MRKSHLALVLVAAVCGACLVLGRHSIQLSQGLLAAGVIAWSALTGFLLFKYTRYVKENPPLALPDKSTPVEPGLVAHWPCNEIQNGFTHDSSGNNLHGELGMDFNFPLFPRPSVVTEAGKQALLFSGRQWVAVPNRACFSVEQFTVTARVWRKKQEFKKGDHFVPTIIAKSTWPANGWWLCADVNSQEIDMGISYGEWFTHVKSGYSLPFEEWHFIGVTMDNINHEVQFFIDGKPYGEKIRDVKQWVTNWDRKLYIGEYDGSCRWPWEGKLADIRFYNTILSEREIAGIYQEAGTKQLDNNRIAAAV